MVAKKPNEVDEARLNLVSERIKHRIEIQEKIIEESLRRIKEAEKEIKRIRELCIHPKRSSYPDPGGIAKEVCDICGEVL